MVVNKLVVQGINVSVITSVFDRQWGLDSQR